MSIQTKEVLKTYFETGDYPTEAQFAALIDSLFHKTDDTLPLASVEGLATQLATLRNADAAIRATLTGSYVTRAQVLALLQQTSMPVAFVDSLPTASADTMNRLYIVPTANGFTGNVTKKEGLPHAASADAGNIIGPFGTIVEEEVEVGMYCFDVDIDAAFVYQCFAIEDGIPQWTVVQELTIGDYVWTRDGKCWELTSSREFELVADPYTYTWTASHTPAQTAAIDWAVQKRAAELQAAANEKWVVTTAASGQNYVADIATSTNMEVTVTTKFNNTLVDCNTTPTGWTRISTGTYRRSVTGASGTVAAASFTYTISGGTYDGLTVSKNSSAKSITVSYPAWHGFATSNDAADLATVLSSLTRVTSFSSTTGALHNPLAAEAYYWIITHNNATLTDTMTGNMLNASVNGQSITSNGIALSGYKVFISRASAAAGGDLSSSCTLSISF